MDVVTEERKFRVKEEGTSTDEKAMATQSKWFKKRGSCHYCRKYGHFKRDCPELAERYQERRSVKDKTRVIVMHYWLDMLSQLACPAVGLSILVLLVTCVMINSCIRCNRA